MFKFKSHPKLDTLPPPLVFDPKPRIRIKNGVWVAECDGIVTNWERWGEVTKYCVQRNAAEGRYQSLVVAYGSWDSHGIWWPNPHMKMSADDQLEHNMRHGFYPRKKVVD